MLAELAAHPRDGDLPDSLHRLARWLVDSLPAPVRRRVREAAVCGRTLPLRLVADVLGHHELADPQGWTDAARLLRPVDGSTLAFRHDAYRVAAYESLPFQRRRELHTAVADRLTQEPDPDDAVLAEHLELAGRGHEAYPRAVRAGRRAKAAGALAEAVDLLARAGRLAHRHDPSGEAGLLVEEGEARVWLSDLDGAERCLRAAARLAVDPLLVGRLCHLSCDLALSRGNLGAAQRWADRGLTVTAALGEQAVELRCMLLLDHAARLHMAGDHRATLVRGEEALALAVQAGSRVMQGYAHLHLEITLSASMDPRAVHHGDEAVRLFEEVGHDRYLQHALTNSGLTLMYLGDWDEALARYRRALEGFERTGVAVGKAITLANIGFLQLRRGLLEKADEHGRRALRLFQAAGLDHQAGYPRLLRAQVAAREGRWDDAAHLVDEARRGFAAIGDDAMVLDCDVTALSHLATQGDHATVLTWGAALEARMDGAEPELRITFERVMGSSLAACGDAAGRVRVEAALATARAQHLLYEVWCCLDTLVTLTGSDDPRAERDALARQLGITDPG